MDSRSGSRKSISDKLAPLLSALLAAYRGREFLVNKQQRAIGSREESDGSRGATNLPWILLVGS